MDVLAVFLFVAVLFGVIILSQRQVDLAQAIQRARVVRLHRHGLLKGLDRLLRLTGVEGGPAQPVARVGVPGRRLDGLPEFFPGSGHLAGLPQLPAGLFQLRGVRARRCGGPDGDAGEEAHDDGDDSESSWR